MLRFTETVMDEINEFTITLLTLTSITRWQNGRNIWFDTQNLTAVRIVHSQNRRNSKSLSFPHFPSSKFLNQLAATPSLELAMRNSSSLRERVPPWLLLVYFMLSACHSKRRAIRHRRAIKTNTNWTEILKKDKKKGNDPPIGKLARAARDHR
jgi:hypothetical protein